MVGGAGSGDGALEALLTLVARVTSAKYFLHMQISPSELEQQIAVFGESGSGKTVLISSFYGAMQEPDFLSSSLFNIAAVDSGQGNRLHQNYLGMKKSARRPELTRFAATSYAFNVRLQDKSVTTSSSQPFEALKLVWHDYPGEWWDEDVSGEQAQRRVETFKALLGSDVAFLLVDGQRLIDNAGEEERYLKYLFTSFRNGLLNLKKELLVDGKPLVKFPRIWILALSKADLLPELDVVGFRDLVIEKAAGELDDLRKVLMTFVESSDALSVGEDFVRFSSAKFEPNKIEVTERIGLNLVLPLAAMLPFERHIKWAQQKQIGSKVAEELLAGAGALAAMLIKKAKYAGPQAKIAAMLGGKLVTAAMLAAVKLGRDQLKKLNSDALSKKDYLTAVLTRFGLDLDEAEQDKVLLTSKK